MSMLKMFYLDDDDDDIIFLATAVGLHNEKSSVHIEMHAFSDADAFMAALKENSFGPAVIMLDINMPKRSGFDVLKEIRQDASLMHHLVVMISTSNDDQTIETSRTFGADRYVVKPSSFEQIRKLVAQVPDLSKYDPSESQRFLI